MISYVAGLAIFAAGVGGWPVWLISVGALGLVDRSWHAKTAYRQRFTGSTAANVLPYATMMCVLQAGCTALAMFGLGRILGVAFLG